MNPTVVNFGGGVNSTAMLGGMVERHMPFDLVLFADTGGERPETYHHVDAVSNWLSSRGFPRIHTVRWIRQTGEFISLEQACIEQNMLPSLAYGNKGCSSKWKAYPADKFVKSVFSEHIESGGRVTRCLGFDAGEERRAKDREHETWDFRYPLIEWGWDRAECLQAIQRLGLPRAAKSSCFFCPAMKRHEVKALREEHPDLYERAIKMERNAHLTMVRGLGRGWSWEAAMKADDDQGSLFPPLISCDCYDGDDDSDDAALGREGT